MKVAQVIEAIHLKHPALKPILSTGIGHRLMFCESELMTRILLRLRVQETVALPIFDAILVKTSKANIAKAVMEEELIRMTDIRPWFASKGRCNDFCFLTCASHYKTFIKSNEGSSDRDEKESIRRAH